MCCDYMSWLECLTGLLTVIACCFRSFRKQGPPSDGRATQPCYVYGEDFIACQ